MRRHKVSRVQLTAPTKDEVRRFITQQTDSGLSYPDVGASATAVPAGYNVTTIVFSLARGRYVAGALGAIRTRRTFSMPWVNLHWQTAPIVFGAEVALSVHHFGFYSPNACLIVYLVDQEGSVERFGFSYGTLVSGTRRERRRTIHHRMEPSRRRRVGMTSMPSLAPVRCLPDWVIHPLDCCEKRFAGFRGAYDESRRWQIALGLERARREIASGHAAASDKSNRNRRCAGNSRRAKRSASFPQLQSRPPLAPRRSLGHAPATPEYGGFCNPQMCL